PMNPDAGKEYVTKFFRRFEERFPGKSGHGINYFFSDELSFRLGYPIWDDLFAGEFLKRKGYDIREHLPALFIDTGPETPRIRLDYNDVMVSLSEEHYFHPLYQWHQDHGMTFGCDHGGRGKEVTEFGDYFRTVRWNQGPGSDQPRLEQDIVKAKVASSIAHLYERPRVWLEGFHSSGWGTSSAQLADAIFGNFVMGYNLLTLHGLYYSTHGGWWEWAPPCNHFRMPYWEHIDPLMGAVQRLSYVLTRGKHRCDVAVLYPAEPVVAGTEGEKSVAAAFGAGEALYKAGIDFDFIDYQSLARSTVNQGTLSVAGEHYRALVVPSMKTIRFASLRKCRDFVRSGGDLINIGSTPAASERGRGDRAFERIRNDLFGDRYRSAVPARERRPAPRSGRVCLLSGTDSLSRTVSRLFTRDFALLSPAARYPKVMHRRIGRSDLYAVYNLPRGTECFFRCGGGAELWNPWTGERKPLTEARSVRGGTVVPLPLSEYDVQLIVFNPGTLRRPAATSPLTAADSTPASHPSSAGRRLPDKWEFSVEPLLDNRWGDFHWPPSAGLIGPEVRRFSYRESDAAGESDESAPAGAEPGRGDTVSCSFGPQFWELGPLPAIIDEDSLLDGRAIDPERAVTFRGTTRHWRPYAFSWRWGVEDDPGHQGYHGLKEQVADDFIRLGKLALTWTSTERVPEPEGTCYCLATGVMAPGAGNYLLETGSVRPVRLRINGHVVDTSASQVSLHEGCNTLLLWYDRPCTTYFVMRARGARREKPDERDRPLAMRWFRDPALLRFDTRYGREHTAGVYTFVSPPGMKRMHIPAHGTVTVTAGGRPLPVTAGELREDDAREYTAECDGVLANPVTVSVRVALEPGWRSGAAIPEPVRIDCGNGIFALGDWSLNDGLRAYSGGARYRTHLRLTGDECAGSVRLDLGSVLSSAALRVNGRDAGTRVCPPWEFDITPCVRPGDNRIEVVVCNTAANQYTGIPTRYGGLLTSGLIGPVTVTFGPRALPRDR
ncbi:MAG TPA: glycosyl hydrolase, partial [Bacteroidota bacterium]|nr:glycosyl hydrolase [Bacteroidota bacterium]